MNQVSLVGRLYQEPELRQSQSGKSIVRTGIAVQRSYKNSEGKYDADFINVIAFNTTADFISKYFKKGQMIGITGSIQTGSYTNKNGQKVYTTDVVAATAEFVESKGNSNTENNAKPQSKQDDGGFDVNDGFKNLADGIDELPFN